MTFEGLAGDAEAAASKRVVLSIARMTLHNGPGIRTLILFKACPLRCLWCSTPEGQKEEPEIAVFPDKCIHCDQCVPVCPLNAIHLTHETISIDRSQCDSCGRCADLCHSEAIVLLGQRMTVEELVEEAKKDMVFYKHSGGGVTLSGGEPLLDPDFTLRLLQALKERGIGAGVDTCGYVPWAAIEPMLPYIDFFLWDIKPMDSQKHRDSPGHLNSPLLQTSRPFPEQIFPFNFRVPLFLGYIHPD